MITAYQLILRDETLRVLALLLPDGRAAREVGQARDLMNAGHLTVAEVRDIAALLARPSRLATEAALDDARTDVHDRLERLDLDALDGANRRVSVFRYDPERDEPRRAIDDHDG